MAAQPCRRSQRLLEQKQDWSTILPHELWELISKRLPSGHDASNFRSMCRLWRDALPFTEFEPVLMLPFDPESPDGVVTFYRLTDGEFFTKDLPALHGKEVCGSSHGWLALVDEAACLTLLNPFTNATVDLPPTDERFALVSMRTVIMLDGRWVHPSPSDGVLRETKLGDMREVFFHEVVLSSPADSGNCIAMALLTESSEVAFCRVGVAGGSWTLLNTGLKQDISCIVHCRSRFLAITHDGQISICNVGGATPTARPVQSFDLPKQVNPLSYLQVNGELHLVCTVVQPGSTTYSTRLYRCNVFARKPVWSRVRNAGDLTLLTSHNLAVGHAGGSVSGLKKNSVYYSGHLSGCIHHDGCKHNPNHVLEIINVANGKSEWLPYRQNTQGSPEAICWIMPNPWTQGLLRLVIP
ncbi:hypothetical protein QYE76_007159 [Lolium multiflorum]|uniref:KIB1-4 beta-propeller domain-containing protein n=1 Tax=Lolium multiflorum TaxID=4521 RepID=A0AAD8RXA1_LOLMU|nr:hypothetical protein QYE76_007159 [Lolium multiflorum]